MTKREILEAAFRVWGADYYLKTSLSELAASLGVTKPALYRHFGGKDELLEAMFNDFTARFSKFIKPYFGTPPPPPDNNEDAPSADSREPLYWKTRIINIALKFAEFYARNRDCFIFSMIHVYGNDEHERLIFECLEGLGFGRRRPDASSFVMLEFVMCGMIFMTACFHKTNTFQKITHNEGQNIEEFLQTVEYFVKHGMGLNADTISHLDWEGIEREIIKTPFVQIDASQAVKAAIKVIAEKGPWDATMEKVAEKLGISKSTMYSHFESKREMIKNVFLTEADGLTRFALLHVSKTGTSEECLYRAVFSIAHYLRENSDILLALDHIRKRRSDIEKNIHEFEMREKQPKWHFQFYGIFNMIKNADGSALINECRAEWIFFIVVNTLMRRSKTMPFSRIPNAVFRDMYRYIALGLEAD
ncbi:MAG: TetR family transcriptional regulator [Spirochaetaceae bacterium]|jgi:AcrR family transcriptional regulator|nr:TetR family transcriptional regulator [Spirochaetaceae bacterium]